MGQINGKVVFALKSVRVWFKKKGSARYISHLDLNRVMTRAIQHSRIPVWHTEGFNPHPFITFALPLSLGFCGEKETMDFKLLEDVSENEIIKRLNTCLPNGIEVYKVTEPVMKAGKIAFAKFEIKFESEDVTSEKLFELTRSLFAKEKIEVEKRSKKGMKLIDIKPELSTYTLEKMDSYVKLEMILPAGSVNNVNPQLFFTALEKENNIEVYTDITRLDTYNEEMKSFC